MSDDSDRQSAPSNSDAATDQKGGWEVVEEVTEELPIEPQNQDQTPNEAFTMDEPAPEAEPSPTPVELENTSPFRDNSPDSPESQPTMSHSQDYAQQHLEHFDDSQEASSVGNSDQYYHYSRPPRKIPYLLIGGVLLGIIGLGLIAKLVFFGNKTTTETPTDVLIQSTSGSPVPSPTVSPSPPTEAIDKASIKIQVLNGSGITGAAGKLAKALEEAGYKKSSTGNAQSYDAAGVRIQVKDGKSSLGDAIEAALKDDYKEITIRETLDEDSEYDAVVTLGKQPGDAGKSADVQGASDSADLKSASDKKSD